MKIKTLAAIAAFSAAFALPSTVMAQESSYTPGTVTTVTYVKVEPGQFENYMDYLGGTYKRSMEFQKREGNVVSWHVYAVNNRREGEPDIILTVEQRDYQTNAEQLALQKKTNEFLATDQHKADTGFGERKKMRTVSGSSQLQELVLK